MVEEEDPGPITYESFHEVCHWAGRMETRSSDDIRVLRGAQKAMAKIYIELLGKIRINSISFLDLKVTQSLLKISQLWKKHKKKIKISHYCTTKRCQLLIVLVFPFRKTEGSSEQDRLGRLKRSLRTAE